MNNATVLTIACAVVIGAGLAAYEWKCIQTVNAQSEASTGDACCPADAHWTNANVESSIEKGAVPESVAVMCTISDPTVLKDRSSVTHELFGSATSTKSTEHGYAFGFDRKRAHEVFDYANFESDCCGFLRFTLTFEENGGPVWLSVETAEEHRPILDEMVGKFARTESD